MSDSILVETSSRIATVTLNLPPLNILDIESLRLLGDRLEEIAADPEIQVVILRGGGEKAFSAGVSLQDHTPERVPEMLRVFHGTLKILADLPAVTVAAVAGHCLGGGMELAAACDLIFATESSRFGQPEIQLGCFPPFGAALYPRRLGIANTVDLLTTGRIVSAAEAARMGFVSKVAADEELEQRLEELTQAVTSKSAAVTRLTKRAILAGRDLDLPPALEECERIYLEELASTEDMQEGLDAFLQKRKPDWKHR